MSDPVTLPLWLLAVVVALAAWTVATRLLLPALRWFVAGRSNVVLDLDAGQIVWLRSVKVREPEGVVS